MLEKLTKPAQLTEVQIAVAVALRVVRERMKTFGSLRNSFAAKKANRFGLKEDTLNIISIHLDSDVFLSSATNITPSSGDLR